MNPHSYHHPHIPNAQPNHRQTTHYSAAHNHQSPQVPHNQQQHQHQQPPPQHHQQQLPPHMSPSVSHQTQWIGAPHQNPQAVMSTARQPNPQGQLAPPQQSPQSQQQPPPPQQQQQQPPPPPPQIANPRPPHTMQHQHQHQHQHHHQHPHQHQDQTQNPHNQHQQPPPPPQHQPQLPPHMSPSVSHQTQWIGAPHQNPQAVMPTTRQPNPQGQLAPPQQSPQSQQPQVANHRPTHTMQHPQLMQRHPLVYETDTRQRMYFSTPNNPMPQTGPIQSQQPFDHATTSASHPSEGNMAPQQQLPNMTHQSNLPLTSPVMNTSVANTTTVHHSQLSNGPAMAQQVPRFSLQPHFSMVPPPSGYIPVHYGYFPMSHYATSQIPQNSSAMMRPALSANNIGSRYGPLPYDPTMTQATPLQNKLPGPTPSSAYQSNRTVVGATYPQPNSATPTTPMLPVARREKKMATICDPKTNRVITINELKDSGISSQTPKESHKDSTQDPTPPPNVDISATTEVNTGNTIDDSVVKKLIVEEDSNQSVQVVDKATDNKIAEQPADQDVPKQVPKKSPIENSIVEPKVDIEQKPLVEAVGDLPAQLKSLSVSSDNKNHGESLSSEVPKVSSSTPSTKSPSDTSREVSRDPSSERKDDDNNASSSQATQLNDPDQPNPPRKSDLPYAEGQYSPSNPQGRRKYSIQFMWAVCKQLKLDTKLGIEQQPIRDSFLPDYLNQNNSYPHPQQRTWQSHSQQFLPKKKIIQPPPRMEVELKTVENPWKPELESEKPNIVEGELDTKRLLKVFRGHLNKLTPQKYDDLILKIKALDLRERDRLNSVINLVFDKAVDEPGFCFLYAKVCKVISQDNTDFNFLLVKKCQEEFETSDLYTGLNVEERKISIAQEKDVSKRKLLHEELYEDMRLRRKKYLGTIKLIGEMYKLDLLLPKIIGLCMKHLIEEANNENLECLCSLIATVGDKMAREKEREIRNAFANTLDILRGFVHNKKTEEAFELESRVRFRILDTIDLSKRNWSRKGNWSNFG